MAPILTYEEAARIMSVILKSNLVAGKFSSCISDKLIVASSITPDSRHWAEAVTPLCKIQPAVGEGRSGIPFAQWP